MLILELQQGIQLSVSVKVYSATIATVAAIRASPGDKLFTPPGNHTVTTVSTLDSDKSLINHKRIYNRI